MHTNDRDTDLIQTMITPMMSTDVHADLQPSLLQGQHHARLLRQPEFQRTSSLQR